VKRKKVFFRADASSQIGLGHLIRSLALAEMLGGEFDVSFVSKEIPQKSTLLLKELNFALLIIIDENTFLSQLTGNEIVVLDHYGLGANYQRQVKEKGCKLVCIDDLHDKHFYADAIINHAPGVQPEQYDAEPYTKFYLGLEYALLRSEFRKQANNKRIITNIDSVLVCFGGADPHNLTAKVLEVITGSDLFNKINIIAGAAFTHFDSLLQLCAEKENVNCYSNLSAGEMLEIMHSSDLAIVPSSSVAIECMSAKMLLLTGITDENQNDIHNGLIKYDTVKTIGDFNTLHDETLLKQLKLIKERSKEIAFSNIGDAGNAINDIFKSLSL